ncbi:hypothetical protein [Streptomyces sp. NBC_01615]|uniref:hypothetical protein n=1 Tax=Streptomyces sp. NBC_01615 TaxID=2975898 RepID=UPI0038643CC0
MQKFDTPAPISAVLDIPAGRIQFIAADRADTTVEVLPADPSKHRDTETAEQTTVAYADGGAGGLLLFQQLDLKIGNTLVGEPQVGAGSFELVPGVRFPS